jgi:hypothetical protein
MWVLSGSQWGAGGKATNRIYNGTVLNMKADPYDVICHAGNWVCSYIARPQYESQSRICAKARGFYYLACALRALIII